jgi:hypothetical protein
MIGSNLMYSENLKLEADDATIEMQTAITGVWFSHINPRFQWSSSFDNARSQSIVINELK